jgi:hypothetical protein
MTLTDFSERTNRPNLSDTRPPRNKFHPTQEFQTRGGKGEELRLQSQEDQELSEGAGASQLILKMTSEHHTVDHTNKIMGSDHGAIFVQFRTAFSNGKTQTLKTVLKIPLVVHTSD